MADFSAVLKKTIEGLGSSNPTTRQKVYEKARQAMRAKLASANPAMTSDMVQRQLKALEDAIEAVEFDFRISDAVSIATPTVPRTSPFAPSRPAPAAPAPAAPAAAPTVAQPTLAPREPIKAPMPSTSATPMPSTSAFATTRPAPAPAPRPTYQPAPSAYRPPPADPLPPDDFSFEQAPYESGNARPVMVRKRSGLPLMLAALAFVLVAGGGAAAWIYKDSLSTMVASLSGSSMPTKPATANAPKADAKAPAAASADAPKEDAGPAKFTQRLTEDGREIDAGPAGGGASVGEGTSVASATQDQAAPLPGTATDATGEQVPAPQPAGQDQAAAATAPVTTAPTAPAAPAAGETVAVAQKAIFYEERTSAAQGSADAGSVVWTLVMDSPGGDLPPEPAIRAEATIPERNLKLRMTIRRNADDTLPASHIVEIVITGPENPASGAIENVLRMTFKDSEGATGNPLFGVPAKIADGFFLIALTDSKAEIEANAALMKREQWIDIPFVYGSGRRALITMEKGVPGEKAFEEAFKAWDAKASG
jgi:hypothetical protein